MLKNLIKSNLIWIKLGIVLASIVSAYFFGASNERNELTLTYTKAYLNQFEHYRDIEHALEERVAQIDEESTKELFDAQDTIDSIVADVGTGRRKLFIETGKTNCKVSKDAKTTSVDHAVGRAELDRGTAQRIIRLTARGDRAIIKLTACQKYIKGLE